MEKANHRRDTLKLLASIPIGIICGVLAHQLRPLVLAVAQQSAIWGRMLHNGIGAISLLPATLAAHDGLGELPGTRRVIVASAISWLATGSGVIIGYLIDALIARHSSRS